MRSVKIVCMCLCIVSWPVGGKIFLRLITIFSLKFIQLLYKNSALVIHVHCEIHTDNKLWGENAELLNVATKGINSYHWASSGTFIHILKHVQMHLKDDMNTFGPFQQIPIQYLFIGPLAVCICEVLHSKCSQSFLHPLRFVCFGLSKRQCSKRTASSVYKWWNMKKLHRQSW